MDTTTLAATHDAARTSRTVMIVNGPGAILDLFEPILEPGHYDVVVVESSAHAYSRIRLLQPDLVVLCVRMEDPTSLQVLSMVRLDPKTAHVPLITYAVDDNFPRRVEDLIDLPEQESWRETVSHAIAMN